MDDFSNRIRSASDTLRHSGYAITRVGPRFLAGLDHVYDAAEAFFDRPADEKARYGRPELLEGYRVAGAEFSASPDRPDLNEAFSLVLRNMGRREQREWAETNALHRALREVAPHYAALANGVLDDLRRSFDPEGDVIDAADFSYLQLNHYRPKAERRELLQDAHEDGHLLTIVKSRQPGLEIEVGGRFEAVSLGRDELLIMPGSILTLMTGGLVEPLVHRVRNVAGVARRASLMFFVNPNLAHPPRAWVAGEDGSLPDIGRATVESSQMFGLGSIGTLAQ